MGQIYTDGATDPDSDYGRLFNPLGSAGQKAAWWDPGGQFLEDPAAEAERQRKALLYGQAATAAGFAGQSQQGFDAYGQQAQGYLGQGQGALNALRAQAQGQNSVSAEQLRQALQQNLAAQQSMAAGAAPRNSAMAARTAAIQSGRLGAGLAGQQAVAGQQERNQAWSQYGGLLDQQQQAVGQLRGQELQAALQSRGQAIQGYGAQNAGTPEKSNAEKYGSAIAGAFSLFASDRRLKTDIQPGDDKANAAIGALQPYAYRYKDPQAYGTGPQLGTTTQDLARAGLGQAIVKTPAGDAVDAGKLSGANTAMIAALGRRIQSLEAGGPIAPPPDDRVRQFATDPKSAWAQFDLDQRRRALAAPPPPPPTDPRATGAQFELDRRRAMLAALAARAGQR